MDSLKTWRDCADPTGYSIREFNSKEQKWWYRPIDAPLTDDGIQKHLKRDDDAHAIWLNIGTDSDPDSRNHTRFMIFDFDDHNERMTADEIHAKVARVARELDANDIPHVLFLSGGGHGMHIWVTFDAPKRVDVMKNFADDILRKAQLERKPGGELVDGFVEVLPKGIGKQVCALPYGRKSIRMNLGDDGVIRETVPQDTIVAFYAGKKAGRKKASQTNEEDRDAAFDAFIQKYDADIRDDWGSAGICLQAAFWPRE